MIFVNHTLIIMYHHHHHYHHHRFLECLQAFAGYSYECNIMALVYIKRMRENMKVPLLHMNSWRGLWVGSIIVAQKIWDDVPLKTSSFKKLLPNVSKHDLNQLERKVLQLLAYSTCVKPSMYARIYFELNEIYNILSMSNNNNNHHSADNSNSNIHNNVRPLSIVRARLLHIAKDRTRLPSINSSGHHHHHHHPTTLFSSPSLIVKTTSSDSVRNASSINNNNTSLRTTSPASGIYPTGPSPKSRCIISSSSTHSSPSMMAGSCLEGMRCIGSSSSTIQTTRSDTFVPNDGRTFVPYDGRTFVPNDGRSLRGVGGNMNRMMMTTYNPSYSTLEDVTRTDSSFFVLS